MQTDEQSLLSIVLSASQEDAESVAAAYAAMVALLRKNTTTSSQEFETAINSLDWGPALASLYKQRFSTTSEIRIKIPKMSVIDGMQLSTNESIKNNFIIGLKP